LAGVELRSVKYWIRFMTTSSRLGVIVLGMHRSGTSAVAGTLVRLGFAEPRGMLPPSNDNPSGFFESTAVAVFNTALLRAAGCTWDNCLSFDPNEVSPTTVGSLLPVALDILRQEFADAPAFMMKDPRLCLTLPVWMPALRAAGANVSALLVTRHPAAVVRSLAWRNGLREDARALLWLHHMLEAERATRSLPRAVIDYDDMMRDWRACLERASVPAGIAWPAGSERDGSDIDGFLDPSLRHHAMGSETRGVGPPRMRGLIDMTWAGFRELRQNPASTFAMEWLDQARATFAARRRDVTPV
jgi:hypothetical protein